MRRLLSFVRQRPAAALGVAAVSALALLLAFLVLRPSGDPRIEAARRKGYPMSPAELDAQYPQTPAAQAAAAVIFKALVNPPVPNPKLLTLGPEEFKSQDWAELKAFFATNQEPLRLLRALPPVSECRYSGSFQQGTKPPLVQLRQGVLFLVSDAVLEASEHKPDAALRSLLAAGTLADSLRTEPMLVSQLLRNVLWSLTCSGTALALNFTSFSEAQLLELERALDQAATGRGLALGLIAERAVMTSMLQDPPAQARTLTAGMSKTDRFNTMLALAVLKATGSFQRDRAYYLDQMARRIDIAEKQPPERYQLELQEATNTVPPGKLYIMSRILLPPSSGMITREEMLTARLAVLQTIIGVERYRIRHSGALPASAQQLVPGCLSSLPLDPFDGKPIRFKPLARGYTVYSVGPNGTDDGGLRPSPKNGTGTGDDVVYTVQRED